MSMSFLSEGGLLAKLSRPTIIGGRNAFLSACFWAQLDGRVNPGAWFCPINRSTRTMCVCWACRVLFVLTESVKMTIVCDSADPLKTWLYKLKCTFKLILCKWFHEFHLALRDDRKISQIHYCYMSCMYVCNETLVVNSVARLNHVEPSVRPGSQEQPLKATDAEVEVGERPTCLQICFYRIQKNKIKTVKLSGSLQSFVFKKNK